jgi:hypothetical protein
MDRADEDGNETGAEQPGQDPVRVKLTQGADRGD